MKTLNTFCRVSGIIFLIGSVSIVSELFRYDYLWYDITACIGRALLVLICSIVLLRIKFY